MLHFAYKVCLGTLCGLVCSINLAMANSPELLLGETVLLSQTEDITGDGKADQIYLVGKCEQAGTGIRNINVVVRDGATKKNSRSFLSDVSGYRPTLEIGTFAKDSRKNVLFTVQTADLNTLVYIVDFNQQPPQVLFQSATPNNETAVRSGQVNIKTTDNNTTVNVKRGSVINLELPENPSTGYTWQFIQSSGGEYVTFLGEQNLIPNDTPDMLGKPSLKLFAFTANRAGALNMQLAKYRLWEGESSAVDHFKVTINIVE